MDDRDNTLCTRHAGECNHPVTDAVSDIELEQMLDDEERDDPEQYVFDSGDYATEEAAMEALEALVKEAMEEGIRAARENSLHVARS